MLASTGASSSGRSASTSVRGEGAGLISTESRRRRRCRRRCSGSRIETSVPRSSPPEIAETAREGRDQREPQAQAGLVDVGLGSDAAALVADDDREPFGVGVGLDA